MTRNHRQNREAYELYLKGRFYTNRRGASIITGIQCFKMAIELDPGFALAHTGYADANLMAAFYGLVPAGQVILKAKESAERALEIDPQSCEPYCSLACYYSCFDWNWEEAEKNFRKSIEINPRYTQAHYWYASLFLVWVIGDFPEAERHGRIAVDLEPLSAICYGMCGSVLHTIGKFTEALEYCKKGTELDAYSFVSHLFKGWSLLSLKRYDEAVTTFEYLMNISNRHHFAHNSLVIAYWLKGEKEKARSIMNDLKERLVKEYIAYAVTGLAASYLGDLDDAFVYFERALVDRDPMMLSLKHEHWVPDTLKADPRYAKLLQKIGFP
jgi:tetratricopeptide (TPR) repeat protein